MNEIDQYQTGYFVVLFRINGVNIMLSLGRSASSPYKVTSLLLCLFLAGCNDGKGSWPAEETTDPGDGNSGDETFYETDTSQGVTVNEGDFDLNTLQSANTKNSDGSGRILHVEIDWDRAFTGSSSVTYNVCQTDASSPDSCKVLATVNDQLSYTLSLNSLLDIANQSYFILASNGVDTLTSDTKQVHPGELGRIAGRFKASNPQRGDNFGRLVAISADGKKMVATAPFEDSAATGVNGDQDNDTDETGASGAAYVFEYDDASSEWRQTAYLKSSNPERIDYFGYGNSLAISDDASVIAIGAYGEDSAFANDQTDNSLSYAGAVYIFNYDGSSYSQTAYLKDATPKENSRFGYSVAISADGTRLAVGSPYRNAVGSLEETGSVSVFDFDGSNWSHTKELIASNAGEEDRMSIHIALSGDGNTLAATSYLEDSDETGVNGLGNNNNAEDSGAVYVFSYANNDWSETAYLKSSNSQAGDYFGYSVALNYDGNTLAIAAGLEDSAATGINGDQTDNKGKGSGAVYLFTRNAGAWTQDAYIKGLNTDGATFGHNSDAARDPSDETWGDHFGRSLALSDDGTILAVGSMNEDSAAIGINWDADDDSTPDVGAAYIFTYDATQSSWAQTAYVKSDSAGDSDWFGRSIDLSSDGSTLAVGAYNESSGSTGVNGEETNYDQDEDNDANFSGAVWIY
tara:strand:+ start:7881 stop:9944 length:2064 start_codon:yes stop_codon:yes gene_type:complete